ncbi:MAG: CBS domain-containing protein [Calditrichaeota bacterium]|nr:MAG: CBS domain-containing protein [Calditrichota bacterium]
MKVRDILSQRQKQPLCVRPQQKVKEAIAVMVQHNVGAVLVCSEHGQLQGIFTERDILQLAHKDPHGFTELPVEQVMTKNPIIARLDDDIQYVEQVMAQNRVRHLPIFDGQTLVSLISIRDVIHAKLQDAQVEKRHLMDYITGKYPA